MDDLKLSVLHNCVKLICCCLTDGRETCTCADTCTHWAGTYRPCTPDTREGTSSWRSETGRTTACECRRQVVAGSGFNTKGGADSLIFFNFLKIKREMSVNDFVQMQLICLDFQVPSVSCRQRNVIVQRPKVRLMARRADHQPDACAVYDTQTQRLTSAKHAQLITHQVIICSTHHTSGNNMLNSSHIR